MLTSFVVVGLQLLLSHSVSCELFVCESAPDNAIPVPIRPDELINKLFSDYVNLSHYFRSLEMVHVQ